ncbi:hypothetical protein [Vibrio gazogenes]|uniref:Uncharacterized protein n=1 Tax=Vibrio gazogenes DSM 21264 = NBRC 103151 TaxID=1123492 RepID=A0A1M4VB39_VIBGA|nr:hypothetical protein [Vibrio gazogenes]USP15581.1 hypothetical protein MKS89_19510 [Vibrio gazogenes]SHE66215.1 hypothetical protein SAMN02745781_00674 [Vibrio gazogenes DSM 21264] [Vibrio gazogenes DSM 21264 = NBRC 103151]SJN57116.1 hypothetical protein BQ6471_02389 [Vibrio gazogenes]
MNKMKFFRSQNIRLVGYVLSAMIAAISTGWLSTELKVWLLGPQTGNSFQWMTFIIGGLLFFLLAALSMMTLWQTRIALGRQPNARHAFNQLPSYRSRILLLVTLLLFAVVLDIGKDIINAQFKNWSDFHTVTFAWWVGIVMLLVLCLFVYSLFGGRERYASWDYLKISPDFYLALLFAVSGIVIHICLHPISVGHYFWFALIGGYLFLQQVRQHSVPTNEAPESDASSHHHLILFVSTCSEHRIEKCFRNDAFEAAKSMLGDKLLEKYKKGDNAVKFMLGATAILRWFSANLQRIQESKQQGGFDHQRACELLLNPLKEETRYKPLFSGDRKELEHMQEEKSLQINDYDLVQVISQYVALFLEQDLSLEQALPQSLKFSELIGIYDVAQDYFGCDRPRTEWRMLFVALEHHMQLNDIKDRQQHLDMSQSPVTLLVSNHRDESSHHKVHLEGSNRQMGNLINLITLFLVYNRIEKARIQFYRKDEHQPLVQVTDEFVCAQNEHPREISDGYGNTTKVAVLSDKVRKYLSVHPCFAPCDQAVLQPDFNIDEYGTDFYQFEQCMADVRQTVASEPVAPWDTVIDFTSGNKVASVVASVMTTTTDIKAQYIDGQYQAIQFDLRYYDLAKVGG